MALATSPGVVMGAADPELNPPDRPDNPHPRHIACMLPEKGGQFVRPPGCVCSGDLKQEIPGSRPSGAKILDPVHRSNVRELGPRPPENLAGVGRPSSSTRHNRQSYGSRAGETPAHLLPPSLLTLSGGPVRRYSRPGPLRSRRLVSGRLCGSRPTASSFGWRGDFGGGRRGPRPGGGGLRDAGGGRVSTPLFTRLLLFSS